MKKILVEPTIQVVKVQLFLDLKKVTWKLKISIKTKDLYNKNENV